MTPFNTLVIADAPGGDVLYVVSYVSEVGSNVHWTKDPDKALKWGDYTEAGRVADKVRLWLDDEERFSNYVGVVPLPWVTVTDTNEVKK